MIIKKCGNCIHCRSLEADGHADEVTCVYPMPQCSKNRTVMYINKDDNASDCKAFDAGSAPFGARCGECANLVPLLFAPGFICIAKKPNSAWRDMLEHGQRFPTDDASYCPCFIPKE